MSTQYPGKPKSKKKLFAGIGCLAIVVIIIAVVASCMAGVGKAVNDYDKEQKTEHTVVYEVSGDAGTAQSITWSTADNGGTSQAADVAVPWTKEVKATGSWSFFSLTASTPMAGGSLTCKITVDGNVVSENTASGQMAWANCSGNTTKK